MIKTKQELLESLGAQGILDFILSNLGSTYRDPNLQWGLCRAPSSRSLLVSEGNMQWVEAHCLHSSPVGPVWWAWTLMQGSRKSCDQMKVTLIRTLMQYSREFQSQQRMFYFGCEQNFVVDWKLCAFTDSEDESCEEMFVKEQWEIWGLERKFTFSKVHLLSTRCRYSMKIQAFLLLILALE